MNTQVGHEDSWGAFRLAKGIASVRPSWGQSATRRDDTKSQTRWGALATMQATGPGLGAAEGTDRKGWPSKSFWNNEPITASVTCRPCDSHVLNILSGLPTSPRLRWGQGTVLARPRDLLWSGCMG